jgi:TonB family protein
LYTRRSKNENFCTFARFRPTRLTTTAFVVTSYLAVLWQSNCAKAGSFHISPELPLFLQRVLVALETDQGVEYVAASGWDRVYLLWMFRNFRSLPQNVLSLRQKQLIGSLYRERSNYGLHELHDAVVTGKIEDFRQSSLAPLPSSVKSRKRVSREDSQPDALTRDPKPFYAGWRLTFNRMTLRVATAAALLVIAILAWHQLGAQSVASSSPTQTAAARPTDEPHATANVAIAKDSPQHDAGPVSVLPAGSPAAAPVVDNGTLSEATGAHAEKAAPAVQRSVAPPVRSAPESARPQTLAVATRPIETTRTIHHPQTSSPKILEAAADPPRTQISGRPQKLVYPVCPETQARGKVSLQAVVGYDGAVSRVRVLTGDRTLAAAAIEAVRQWRYEPSAPHLERETNITISFISDEVVAVSFPNSGSLSR